MKISKNYYRFFFDFLLIAVSSSLCACMANLAVESVESLGRGPASSRGSRVNYHVWDVLKGEDKEKTDYAMYTYVLFGRRVDDDLDAETRDRYKKLLYEIMKNKTTSVAEGIWAKEESNIFYIPGFGDYDKKRTIENYNSDLAMRYLAALIKLFNDNGQIELKNRLDMHPGPFLISTLKPLTHISGNKIPILFADISYKNPAIIENIVASYKIRITDKSVAKVEIFEPVLLKVASYLANYNDLAEIYVAKLIDFVRPLKDLL